MTLCLNLFMVAHLCIQLGRPHEYTQRYGLKEHSLILDVDFSCSEVRCQTATANKSQVFEYWAVSSLATDAGENQSAVPCDNDVIRSDWVRPIGLRQLEFHARTLYIDMSKKSMDHLKQHGNIMVLWLYIPWALWFPLFIYLIFT